MAQDIAYQAASGRGNIPVSPDRPLPVADTSRLINVAFTTLTRPANTTAYTANDSISDNATAGSVTAIPGTVSDLADAPVALTSLLFSTTDTGLGGKSVRAWLYNSDPTANSGVVAGDNAAFSNKRAGFIGTMSGALRAMSDGAVGVLVPDEDKPIIASPGSGVRTFWVQYQTLSDFTPSANSTTLTGTARGLQGRV